MINRSIGNIMNKLICIAALAHLGLLLIIDRHCDAAHIIEYKMEDVITQDKLSRMLSKDMGPDEKAVAVKVVNELARTRDKYTEKKFADKYSVYDLLHLDFYDEKHLHYCSKGEIEARLDVCQDLKDHDLENLAVYCEHVTAMYFDICNEHKDEIISKSIIAGVPDLKFKKIKEFSAKFDKYIQMDGDEDEPDETNMTGFLADNTAKKLSELIRSACSNVVSDFETVVYFDEDAQLEYDYLVKYLTPEEAKALSRCNTLVNHTAY